MISLLAGGDCVNASITAGTARLLQAEWGHGRCRRSRVPASSQTLAQASRPEERRTICFGTSSPLGIHMTLKFSSHVTLVLPFYIRS
jgi:hypothetical protein